MKISAISFDVHFKGVGVVNYNKPGKQFGEDVMFAKKVGDKALTSRDCILREVLEEPYGFKYLARSKDAFKRHEVSMSKYRILRGNLDNKPSKVTLVLTDNKSNSTYARIIYTKELFENWKEFVKENFSDVQLSKREVHDLVEKFNVKNKKLIEEWIENNVDSSREAVKGLHYKSYSKKKNKDSAPIVTDGLRGRSGRWAVFFTDDNYSNCKIYSMSKNDFEYLKSSFEAEYNLKDLKKKTKGKSFKCGEYDFMYTSLYARKTKFQNVYNQARKVTQALPLQKGHDCLAFKYDLEKEIEKNRGVIKIRDNISEDSFEDEV